MNTWVRRSLKAGALTAGAVMATGTAAYADTTLISADNTGILNGTQVFAPIQAPINLCGVAAAVLGDAQAGCGGGSAASLEGLYDVEMVSTGNTGILNGTQVFAPIQAPINLCGVAAAVLGTAQAGCEGGASAELGQDGHHHRRGGYNEKSLLPKAEVLGSLPVVGSLTQSLPLSGLTRSLPLHSIPLVGPLLSGVLGAVGTDAIDLDALDSVGTVHRTESTGEGDHSDGGQGGGKPGCGTTCPAPAPPQHTPCPPEHGHGHHSSDVTLISSGNTGILNGTQIYAPIQIPIDISGLAIGVLGNASAASTGGSSTSAR